MKFKLIFKIFCVVYLSSVCFVAQCKPKPKPNIIVIMVDDLGWSDLGCTGSTFYETKYIDQLAREGVIAVKG